MSYTDTKIMPKIELIKTFFDNPTEAREFFRVKMISLVVEIIKLKYWIKGWVKDMEGLDDELHRIIGKEAIYISSNYKEYKAKQKELKNIVYCYKLASYAFLTENQTGYRKDQFAERLNTAKGRPIIDIAGRYVEIKNNKALCPFHEEKKPSLNFYPKTNSFSCFGCKVGGGVIDFIMLIENKDFKEAVEILNRG